MNKQKLRPVHIKYLLLSLIAVFVFNSCAEEGVFEDGRTIVIPESQELVTSTIYARVIDDEGLPVSGAEVSILSASVPIQQSTDDDGYILIEDIENKGASAYLTVRSTGKFNAFRRYSLLSGRYNYTEIVMMDKRIAGNISASSGGTVSHQSGAQVSIGESTVVDINGSEYFGNVNVAMTWIDPSADDLASRVIGDLSGIDLNGQNRSLSSFGMVTVELFDDAGNELNINSKGAVLTFPIPVEMRADAQSTIPLWSYDEILGTWIQEGEATLDGNTYVGEVFHFSSFNVDFMTDPIEITGQVLWETEGGPIGGSFLSIYVCSERIGRKGGWLCEDGSFRFYNFPKDEEFVIKIFDDCRDEIYRESFGPFSESKNLGNISVTTNEGVIKVYGNALNCDGAPVENALLSVLRSGSNLSFPVGNDGSFEFGLDICKEGSYSMTIVDLTAEKSKTIELSTEYDTISLENIEICDELVDFISISIDDGLSVLLTPNVLISSYRDSLPDGGTKEITKILYIQEDSIQQSFLEMRFCSPETVPAEIDVISFVLLNSESVAYFSEDGTMHVNIDIYDNFSGGRIEGTFSGMALKENATGETQVTITGSFKIPIR